MDRLQKKCVIVSAGLHSLLVLTLFVGPAFLTSAPDKLEDMPVLDFVPLKTVDSLMSGGGNPSAMQSVAPPQFTKPAPPVQAPPPQPKPQPQVEKSPPVDPEPIKPAVKEIEPDPDSFEPAPEKRRRLPEVSLKPILRRPSEDAKAKAKAQAQAEQRRQEQAAAEARNRLAATIGQVASNLGSSLSSGTSIELKGPGGGGVPYANWLQAVKSRYVQALIEPEGITDEGAIATASVTIRRDGTVIHHRISHPSGNQAFDRAVRATLDRVEWAAPLPDDAKEDERTVEINFKPRMKEARG